MTRFLLDTNVLSEPMRPEPDQKLMACLEHESERLATATPVWHELVYGARRLPPSKRRSALERFLAEVVRDRIPILPYCLRAATWHGQERARLGAIGNTPAFVDGQIAAIAAVNDLTLVTANTSDFEVFEGLAVENWK